MPNQCRAAVRPGKRVRYAGRRRSAPGFLTGEELPKKPCDTARSSQGGARTWLPQRHRSSVADRPLARPDWGELLFHHIATDPHHRIAAHHGVPRFHAPLVVSSQSWRTTDHSLHAGAATGIRGRGDEFQGNFAVESGLAFVWSDHGGATLQRARRQIPLRPRGDRRSEPRLFGRGRIDCERVPRDPAPACDFWLRGERAAAR
jgi:hypothetical protein